MGYLFIALSFYLCILDVLLVLKGKLFVQLLCHHQEEEIATISYYYSYTALYNMSTNRPPDCQKCSPHSNLLTTISSL